MQEPSSRGAAVSAGVASAYHCGWVLVLPAVRRKPYLAVDRSPVDLLDIE
jgi:hypothetical protein